MTKSDYKTLETQTFSKTTTGARVFQRGVTSIGGQRFQRPFYWVPRTMATTLS